MTITAETATDYFTRCVHRCAFPAEGLSIKGQIRQAARNLGWSYNRTRKAWYGEARLRHEEILMLWRTLDDMERRASSRTEAKREMAEFLSQVRPDFES